MKVSTWHIVVGAKILRLTIAWQSSRVLHRQHPLSIRLKMNHQTLLGFVAFITL